MRVRASTRAYAVMKTGDSTFWVRSAERWLPRKYGAPPSGCGVTKADADSLLEAVKLHGHDDAKVVLLW